MLFGRHHLTVRFLEGGIRVLKLRVKLLPFLVKVLAVVLVLLHSVDLLLSWVQAKGLFESERIDFLKNGLQSDQTLLQDPI